MRKDFLLREKIQTANSVVHVDLFSVPGILTWATFLNSQNANLN